MSRAIEATLAPPLPSLLISSILSTPIISFPASHRRNRSSDNVRPRWGWSACPCPNPKVFRDHSRKLRVIKSASQDVIKHRTWRTAGAPRLWRAMDLARSACYLEYAPCRVRCPGARACAPRPSPGRGTGRASRATSRTGWRGWRVRCTASAVSELARVEWHSVGGVCRRVYARAGGRARRLEVRRRAPHRHRRDVAQEGPQVRHGGRRPRPRLPHLGARGHRQGRAQPVPRRAHARAEARHRGGDRRRREVDKAAGQAPLPPTRGGSGPLPRGPVDERRARRRALRGVERRQGRRPGPPGQGPRASAAGLPKASCRPRRSGRSRRRRPPSRAAATRS